MQTMLRCAVLYQVFDGSTSLSKLKSESLLTWSWSRKLWMFHQFKINRTCWMLNWWRDADVSSSAALNRTEQFCVSVNAPRVTSQTSSRWWHQRRFISLAHCLHDVQLHVFSEPLCLSDKPSSMLLPLMKQGHRALLRGGDTRVVQGWWWCKLAGVAGKWRSLLSRSVTSRRSVCLSLSVCSQ